METEEIIIYCLLMLFGVAGFILIHNNVPSAEAMAAWTFTGHTLVEAIIPYISYIYLIILMLIPIYKITKELK